MNVERITQVANAILNDTLPNVRFNMNYWTHYGKEGVPEEQCIGGYCLTMLGNRNGGAAEVSDLFDISFSEAYTLCYPPAMYDYDAITRQQAYDCLMHLAATGEVVWGRLNLKMFGKS